MMWWNGDWSWWGWLSMTVSMIVFWGLIIWGIVALVRSLSPRETRTGSTATPQLRPEEILAERFARGEIDAGEYARRLEVLRAPQQGLE